MCDANSSKELDVCVRVRLRAEPVVMRPLTLSAVLRIQQQPVISKQVGKRYESVYR
jgi:hypothetical protein